MNRPAGLLADPHKLPIVVPDGTSPIPPVPMNPPSGPIKDNGEKLILAHKIPGVIILPAYPASGWEVAPRVILLREQVIAHLTKAAQPLPTDFGICLLDGWRPTRFQEALHAFYSNEEELEPGFVADPRDVSWVVPPHTTGGAVDLTLLWREASPLMLGTDFDSFTPAAQLRAFESATSEPMIRALRRLLTAAMVAAGLAPYAMEWWHFSYGDQQWARFHRRSVAIYGAIHEVSELPALEAQFGTDSPSSPGRGHPQL